MKDVDNVRLYLAAYLTDVELPGVISSHGKIYENLKAMSVADEQNNKRTKTIVKGARLKLYPPGLRIYRASRGAKKPEIIGCTETEAIKGVGNVPLTFEQTIKIIDDSGKGFNIINYRRFNKTRKAVQPDSG